MTNKPTKSDLKRISKFEVTVKNINHLLKGKSIKEINIFFDEQDKILIFSFATSVNELSNSLGSEIPVFSTGCITSFQLSGHLNHSGQVIKKYYRILIL
jgi:hypothetical protein